MAYDYTKVVDGMIDLICEMIEQGRELSDKESEAAFEVSGWENPFVSLVSWDEPERMPYDEQEYERRSKRAESAKRAIDGLRAAGSALIDDVQGGVQGWELNGGNASEHNVAAYEDAMAALVALSDHAHERSGR